MFRAASRLPKRTFLAASAVGTVVLDERSREKLSIYPSPNPEIILVQTPSALEAHIGIARRQLCQTYRDGRNYIQGWVSKWIGVEHAVENRVKSILSPQESLTPGLLYIGVATLTGSIFARNRRLFTRLILPPTFLLVSAKYFLPKTTANLSGYLGSLEENYFPGFSEKHEIAKAHTAMTWNRLKEATRDTRAQLNRSTAVAIGKVQEATGLKLKESLGWAGEARQSIEAKATDIEESVVKAIEETKEVVEQTFERVKGEVDNKAERAEEDEGGAEEGRQSTEGGGQAAKQDEKRLI